MSAPPPPLHGGPLQPTGEAWWLCSACRDPKLACGVLLKGGVGAAPISAVRRAALIVFGARQYPDADSTSGSSLWLFCLCPELIITALKFLPALTRSCLFFLFAFSSCGLLPVFGAHAGGRSTTWCTATCRSRGSCTVPSPSRTSRSSPRVWWRRSSVERYRRAPWLPSSRRDCSSSPSSTASRTTARSAHPVPTTTQSSPSSR